MGAGLGPGLPRGSPLRGDGLGRRAGDAAPARLGLSGTRERPPDLSAQAVRERLRSPRKD